MFFKSLLWRNTILDGIPVGFQMNLCHNSAALVSGTARSQTMVLSSLLCSVLRREIVGPGKMLPVNILKPEGENLMTIETWTSIPKPHAGLITSI